MNIQFNTEGCCLNSRKPNKIMHKYVNIFVKISDKCQAKCKFCIYHDTDPSFKFNFTKFKQTIKKLMEKNIYIHRVSFTGGEPTLNTDLLNKCIHFVKSKSSYTFVSVNTNGLNAHDVEDADSLSLSKHHYLEKKIFEIFGCKTINSTNIKRLQKDKGNVHLSCNIIKGYIDTKQKILNYLEYASSLGVYDVGFVGIMNVNEYATKHLIDFGGINIESSILIRNKDWHVKGNICKCSNYLYMPKEGTKVVHIYYRHRCKHNIDMKSNIVFDGEDLRHNFNGPIIKI